MREGGLRTWLRLLVNDRCLLGCDFESRHGLRGLDQHTGSGVQHVRIFHK
jgi:hypothetical protein